MHQEKQKHALDTFNAIKRIVRYIVDEYNRYPESYVIVMNYEVAGLVKMYPFNTIHDALELYGIGKETSDEFRLVCGYLYGYREELLLFGITPSGSCWRYKDKLLAVRQVADQPMLEVLW